MSPSGVTRWPEKFNKVGSVTWRICPYQASPYLMGQKSSSWQEKAPEERQKSWVQQQDWIAEAAKTGKVLALRTFPSTLFELQPKTIPFPPGISHKQEAAVKLIKNDSFTAPWRGIPGCSSHRRSPLCKCWKAADLGRTAHISWRWVLGKERHLFPQHALHCLLLCTSQHLLTVNFTQKIRLSKNGPTSILTMLFLQSQAALANQKCLPFTYLHHHHTQNMLSKAGHLLSKSTKELIG